MFWDATGQLVSSNKSSLNHFTFTLPQTDPLNRELDVSIYLGKRSPPRNPINYNTTENNYSNYQFTGNLGNKGYIRGIMENRKNMEEQSLPKWRVISHLYNRLRGSSNVYSIYFPNPTDLYMQLISHYGQPDLINSTPNGIAIWLHPMKGIDRIDLCDEECYHSVPYPHVSCLYTYTRVKLPTKCQTHLSELSSDLFYDPIRHLLIIRGVSIDYNVAIALLICLYAGEEYRWYDLYDGQLLKTMTNIKNLLNPRICRHNLVLLQKYLIRLQK